ncbi:AAA family ATPase [Aureicoccus marinus]|uniref:AAA family ATPase n=1 Tax=Aureicoccus marinus TaxID=754435 RepID=UPI001FE7AFA7|nr:ATP-binding protein [Aureicoccus marinus]
MQRIAISGGPGTGKTCLIDNLIDKGYHCFPEIIRTFTEQLKKETAQEEQQINPLTFSKDPLHFNTLLLEGRSAQWKEAENTGKELCFFDRSVIDVLGYMDHFEQEYPNHFIDAAETLRYDTVFLLPPWQGIYVQDDQRLEPFEEAERIHVSLLASYQHFGYAPLFVPTGTIEERIEFILRAIATKEKK